MDLVVVQLLVRLLHAALQLLGECHDLPPAVVDLRELVQAFEADLVLDLLVTLLSALVDVPLVLALPLRFGADVTERASQALPTQSALEVASPASVWVFGAPWVVLLQDGLAVFRVRAFGQDLAERTQLVVFVRPNLETPVLAPCVSTFVRVAPENWLSSAMAEIAFLAGLGTRARRLEALFAHHRLLPRGPPRLRLDDSCLRWGGAVVGEGCTLQTILPVLHSVLAPHLELLAGAPTLLPAAFPRPLV
mmetsp:Transcript_73008/g.237380  ORF Transcript_73008/g.237380 Transcript_73008/m.237380 type:complete len:249 (+) Transcript_73008:541-1287(+)